MFCLDFCESVVMIRAKRQLFSLPKVVVGIVEATYVRISGFCSVMVPVSIMKCPLQMDNF